MTTVTWHQRTIDAWIRQHGWGSFQDFLDDQLDAGVPIDDIPQRLRDVLDAEDDVVSSRTIRRWLKRAGWEAQGKETA